MKNKLRIKHRLILPVILLGVVALISNILSVFSIHNVNANASDIVDNYMTGAAKLEEIRRSITNTHKMALSHIVAADYQTMIQEVKKIKAEEAVLEENLEGFRKYITGEEETVFQQLLDNYDSFRHSLVFLVCASADSKTQDAYNYANGDVASFAAALENNINDLDSYIKKQAAQARNRLSQVYVSSLITSILSIVIGILLVMAAISIILKYVIRPIHGIIYTLQGSSDRINHVTGEVLNRTRTSNKSTRELYSLAQSLSGTMQDVAGNASVINKSAADIKEDVNNMAEECGAIRDYSSAMKIRAGELEQSAQNNMDSIRAKAAEISTLLEEAIEKSRSVDQINTLTKDIMSIADSTNLIALNASLEAAQAGAAGKGFGVLAGNIRELANCCGDTAGRIQEINKVVTGAVYNLSEHAQDLAGYLNGSILSEFQEFVESGKQYKQDADYIEQVMAEFNSRTERLRNSMNEIASSIEKITQSMDNSAAGITGVADSTQSLAGNMSDITNRMDINQEIVVELQEQTDKFANL